MVHTKTYGSTASSWTLDDAIKLATDILSKTAAKTLLKARAQKFLSAADEKFLAGTTVLCAKHCVNQLIDKYQLTTYTTVVGQGTGRKTIDFNAELESSLRTSAYNVGKHLGAIVGKHLGALHGKP